MKVAKGLGADYVVNASRGNVVKKVFEFIGGVDVAIECVGVEESFRITNLW